MDGPAADEDALGPDDRGNEALGEKAKLGDEPTVAVRTASGQTIRTSFWKAALIEERAERAKELDDPNGLVATLSARSEDMREKREENTRQQYAQLGEMLRDQAEERERWMHTQSTVGGVTLEGQEWEALGKRLREDDEFKSRVMALFMARGMSEREAEARYERAAEVAEIMAIPPTQRTEEQQRVVDKADADPTFKEDMADIKIAEGRGLQRDQKSELGLAFDGAAGGSQPAAQTNPLPTSQPAQVAELGL